MVTHMPTTVAAARRTVPILVHAEPDLARRVREAAAIQRRSVSNFGSVVLEQAVGRVLTDGRSDAHEQAERTVAAA